MKMMNAIKKSKSATSTDETGMTSLGKYIFFMICALFTMLLADVESPEKKEYHSTRPEKTTPGYGTSSRGTLRARPMKSAKMTRTSKRRRSDHRNPRKVR